MKLIKGIFLIAVAALFAASCASRSTIAYLQNIESASMGEATAFEPTLKPDDLLSIIISAETPEVTVPFNLPAIQGNYEIGNNQNGIKTYLIDTEGNIDYPVIGRIQLAGLTRSQAIAKISEAVSEYIKNPSVNLRILNFKVTILGEVTRPGSYTIASERITLLEALAYAGDLTIFGKRENILLIREVEGKKTFTRIDITKADFINSPYYYLTQNDQIVVEPNKTRVNASAYGPNITAIISIVSLVTSVVVLILR